MRLNTIILWRIDSLLSNDHEMGGYTRAVSGKRLGKHVPVARQQIINNAAVGRNNRSCVFYVVRAEIYSKGQNQLR
jgi:hypothetical protein